jgi:hypothetical protein
MNHSNGYLREFCYECKLGATTLSKEFKVALLPNNCKTSSYPEVVIDPADKIKTYPYEFSSDL